MMTSALLLGGQHGSWCGDLLVEDETAGAQEWAQSVADALVRIATATPNPTPMPAAPAAAG
jgi:hypothetical protein